MAPLDFESTPTYQLIVRATDAKTSSHGEVDVHVTVLDVNDFSPVFNESLYLATISEAVSVGTSVMVVPAVDKDSGVNRQITYSLKEESDFFSIDANTSEISVAAKLDYEARIVYDLVVVATDGGTPSMTGEARVRIVLQDANDNPPRFTRDTYHTAILGSAGPGFFVTRVIATDADDSDAAALRYSITSGDGRKYFHIDPRSGVITLSKVLGIEPGKVYDLDVAVTDNVTTARAQVRVVIGDTNQHSPVFSQDVYQVEFHENYAPDTFVTMVAATDRDSGNFSRLSYSIDSVEAARKFRIDPETGMIYSRISLDRENPAHAFTHLPVRATDGGGRFGFCAVEVSHGVGPALPFFPSPTKHHPTPPPPPPHPPHPTPRLSPSLIGDLCQRSVRLPVSGYDDGTRVPTSSVCPIGTTEYNKPRWYHSAAIVSPFYMTLGRFDFKRRATAV